MNSKKFNLQKIKAVSKLATFEQTPVETIFFKYKKIPLEKTNTHRKFLAQPTMSTKPIRYKPKKTFSKKFEKMEVKFAKNQSGIKTGKF